MKKFASTMAENAKAELLAAQREQVVELRNSIFSGGQTKFSRATLHDFCEKLVGKTERAQYRKVTLVPEACERDGAVPESQA